MTIVGVDYSTKAVHLAWNLGGWQWPHYVISDDLGEFLEALWYAFPDSHDDGHIFIERPWARYNAWTGMQMQRIATIVDVVATQRGYQTHWVAIAQWRSAIFGKGKYPTKIAKAKSIDIALETIPYFNGKKMDDNTADSICLALYGQSRLAEQE